ncbi:MAG: hypothetical protein P8H53_09665 [Paracoccaceae bacterium]|nr:hypothetical protein [Paracoccaceae bacterium]
MKADKALALLSRKARKPRYTSCHKIALFAPFYRHIHVAACPQGPENWPRPRTEVTPEATLEQSSDGNRKGSNTDTTTRYTACAGTETGACIHGLRKHLIGFNGLFLTGAVDTQPDWALARGI